MSAPGQVIGRQRERLTRVALYGGAGGRVDDHAVNLDQHRFEAQVELGRRQSDGPGDEGTR